MRSEAILMWLRLLRGTGLRRSRVVLALGVGAALIGPLTLAGPVHAATLSGATAAAPCHNVSGSSATPLLPAGHAYVVTETLQADCTFAVSETLVSIPMQSRGVDPQATSYYKLWDCCGKELNGTATTITWTTSNGRITSAGSAIHHRWYPDGWSLFNEGYGFYSGCVGCTSISASGTDHFVFLPAPVFNNVDYNYITALGNNGYSNCYSTWWWQTGFPGWGTQTWCGFGFTGI